MHKMGWLGVVRGDPRSSAMSTSLRAHMISYSSLTETMRLSCTVLEIQRVMKFADFTLPHLHLAPPLGVAMFEFRKYFWHQKTRVPELLCGVVCVILSQAVFIQYWLVTDTQTGRQTHKQANRQTDGQKHDDS